MSNLEPPTLELVQETKLWRLLPGCDAGSRLEASGVLAHDGHFHVIFDNVSTIASIDANFAVTPDNCMVGRPDGVCGFEDITFNDRPSAITRWSRPCHTRTVAFGRRSRNTPAALTILRPVGWTCPSSRRTRVSRGIVYLSRGNSDYVLGLCEGNRCQGGAEGRKPGGGRIHVLQKQDGAWRSIATIALPESLDFVDYASMAVRGDHLAVVSQTSAELWVGRLDPERWEVVDDGTVFRFPRSRKKGRVKYCTVEGISWLDDSTFVAVSDRMKPGEQHAKCEKRDQSIHIFRLPATP